MCMSSRTRITAYTSITLTGSYMTVSGFCLAKMLDILTMSLELKNWLVNAFNGEWLRVENAVPKAQIDGLSQVR